MRFIALALAALSAAAAAQFYDVQSTAFRLILKSDNSTLNGQVLRNINFFCQHALKSVAPLWGPVTRAPPSRVCVPLARR